MPDAYVIEVSGRTAGIVARDSHSNSFNFFSAAPRFNAKEGQRFSDHWQPSARRGCLTNTGVSRGAAKRKIPAQSPAGVVSVSGRCCPYKRSGGLNAALRKNSFRFPQTHRAKRRVQPANAQESKISSRRFILRLSRVVVGSVHVTHSRHVRCRDNAVRLAVTGCNAQPALGHLHGDCAQKITFADFYAAMAQDRVGGCEMEIEVRQHKMV